MDGNPDTMVWTVLTFGLGFIIFLLSRRKKEVKQVKQNRYYETVVNRLQQFFAEDDNREESLDEVIAELQENHAVPPVLTTKIFGFVLGDSFINYVQKEPEDPQKTAWYQWLFSQLKTTTTALTSAQEIEQLSPTTNMLMLYDGWMWTREIGGEISSRQRVSILLTLNAVFVVEREFDVLNLTKLLEIVDASGGSGFLLSGVTSSKDIKDLVVGEAASEKSMAFQSLKEALGHESTRYLPLEDMKLLYAEKKKRLNPLLWMQTQQGQEYSLAIARDYMTPEEQIEFFYYHYMILATINKKTFTPSILNPEVMKVTPIELF